MLRACSQIFNFAFACVSWSGLSLKMQNLFLNNFVVYATLLLINLHRTCSYNLGLLHFFVQILEFDLKGIALDNSSSLTIIVKDFETIGQNKYVLFFSFPV